MTIDLAVQCLWMSFLVLAPLAAWLGWRRVASSRRLRFYLLRREQAVEGWRAILLGVLLVLLATLVWRLGRPAAYAIFRPTASITPTATATSTPTPSAIPTITVTPSISLTPSITPTASSTVTPQLPERLVLFFQETVTPRPDVLFSPVLITDRLNAGNLAVDPRLEFTDPPRTLYGAFSYENLQNGVRWTALWYFRGEVICYESTPWDGGTGGYGYTDCAPPDGWRVGDYEIQIFVGLTWKVTGRFAVLSVRPTPTLTPSPSGTPG
jgi:hypothetical protein